MDTTALRNLASVAGSPAGNKITVEQGLEEAADLLDSFNSGTETITVDSVTVTDEAYDSSGWNGDLTAPTKNAVRDKIVSVETEIAKFLVKAANYNNVDAAISKTSGSYGYLNFSSADSKVTINVAAGETVVINAGCFFSCSAAGTYPQFSLFQNAVAVGSVSNARPGTYSSTGEDYQYNTCLILTAPATGSVEYSLRWMKAAGAGTVYARFPYLSVYTLKAS